MKKALVGILTTALVLCGCVSAALAAGHGCGRHANSVCGRTAARCAYVDANCDGICDTCHSYYYVDADCDGVCDHAGTRCAYVDANGDGVCDHFLQSGLSRGCGHGARHSQGHHHGCRSW